MAFDKTTNRADDHSVAAERIENSTINIGITLEQHEARLQSLEVRLRTELANAHEQDKSLLQSQLDSIYQQLLNAEESYHLYVQNLKERIAHLESIRGQVPDELLSRAKIALAEGNNDDANALFQQVIDQAEAPIKAAAEANYQRCLLAEDELRFADALTLCQRATQLTPNNSLYLNQAGILSDTLAQYAKAIEYYEQALISTLKTSGGAHPSVAIYRNNLGLAWQAQGDIPKAIDYFEQALASDLKTYGEVHPSVAVTRNNLGMMWKSQGGIPKAIDYFEQALASDLKTYGEAHPSVATDRNNLGGSWYLLGEYSKAIDYFEQALAALNTVLGADHSSTNTVRNNLEQARIAFIQLQAPE